MSAALTIEGVHTHIGRYHILQGVDFDAPAGLTTMLLGRNGAGKTTSLRTIMGLWRASKGRIMLGSTPLQDLAASDVARLGVGYAPETMSVFSDLSVKENLVLGARAMQRVASLSHGDQRKLEVAMMMALEPTIFMFDEPTAGMSIDEVPVVLDLIARLKTDKTKTILLVEHKMDVVRSLADRIIVLNNGQLVADGEPAAVIASPIVQEAYLGIAKGAASCACVSRSKASPPTSDAITFSKASTSTRPRARRRCCSGATAPARRRACAPSWGCGAPRAARSRWVRSRSRRCEIGRAHV